MVRYEFSLCIGQANTDSGITVKCHDDGISFLIKLMVCRQVSKWRTKEEAFTIPEGSKVILKIAKPDNTKCLISGTVKADGVLFKSKPEAFTVAGIYEAEVSVYGADGRRATTATFNIDVPEECVCNCEVESGPYVDIIGEQIKAAKEAEAAAKEAAEKAMQAQVNAPTIGDNGNWFVWDYDECCYVDTGVAARGGGGEGGGADGATFIPHLSEDGVLSWTNDRGLPNPKPVNIKGEPGTPGAPGDPGKDGKSAFEYAVDGGYIGSEETFTDALSSLGDLEAALDGIIAIQETYIAQSPAPVNEEVSE